MCTETIYREHSLGGLIDSLIYQDVEAGAGDSITDNESPQPVIIRTQVTTRSTDGDAVSRETLEFTKFRVIAGAHGVIIDVVGVKQLDGDMSEVVSNIKEQAI